MLKSGFIEQLKKENLKKQIELLESEILKKDLNKMEVKELELLNFVLLEYDFNINKNLYSVLDIKEYNKKIKIFLI